MTDELKPETLDTYESLMASLRSNDRQEELLCWLYQELSNRVAVKLEETDMTAHGFKPYDIVDVSMKELFEEFQLSADYNDMKDIFTNKHEVLVKFLKLGYGTPEEIFSDYGSDSDD